MRFQYQRRVAFSDTDAMGVAHHAAYVRFVEEARVAWMRERGLSATHFPHCDLILAVLHFQVWHLKPCTFDDLLTVEVEVRRDGSRVRFQYAVSKDGVRIAEATTSHITVNKELRPVRPSPQLVAQVEKEKWTETWLSNS